MSGHSKFANIKHKKEKNDAAKGKIFTVIGREIAVAVKEGGPDPANNFKLAQVIQKAKSNNMPNDTIERGIKKAAGDVGNINYQQNTYEAAFAKGNGNIGTPGCVSYMFDEKGQIIIDKEDCDMTLDDLMMIALEAGADDIQEEEDSFEVLTAPDDFQAVCDGLKEAGIETVSAEITKIPQNYVSLTDEKALKEIRRILDILDDDDDVQAVYHNWDEVE